MKGLAMKSELEVQDESRLEEESAAYADELRNLRESLTALKFDGFANAGEAEEIKKTREKITDEIVRLENLHGQVNSRLNILYAK
jgi:hypothetical protein